MEMNEIKQLSDDDLEEACFQALTEIADIKSQLEKAKRDVAEGGEYSDSDWYRKASYALRIKSRDHQMIQRELGKRNKAARKEKQNTFEQRFIEAAKANLSPGDFQLLVDEANA